MPFFRAAQEKRRGVMRILRAVFVALRDFVRAVEVHGLFTHASASAFFLFLSLPPALLALVVMVGLIPIEEWTASGGQSLLESAQAAILWFAPEESAIALSHVLELRLAPLLAGLDDLSRVSLLEEIQGFLDRSAGPSLARSVGTILADILGNPKPGLLTASFFVILWSASGATRAAMRALGEIYEVRRRSWVKRNSLGLLLTVFFLLAWTVILALLPVFGALTRLTANYLDLGAGALAWWSATSWCLGALLLFLSVLVFHRLGPDVSLRSRALAPGSFLTVALWAGLSWGLGEWLEHSWQKHNSTYGALAGVIAVLLWCYLISLGLLLGAECNTALLRWRGRDRRVAGPLDLAAATRAVVEPEVVADPIEARLLAGDLFSPGDDS
ncbi:MAG TPA: YihY/virulence factor BrkB family protein [Planctomycetes bacterium]|jgi:YihY family inner membrane protein|nr:YihY/virulence factor BrkB family protein [Planctomycetota bacterium]HIL53090.1 YihY/virulence factor BrkB family protein [Planctomycetota bacterium]